MAVRLLVGPAGSGKTGRALKLFKEYAPSEHLRSVRMVVATDAQAAQIRRLLLSDPEFAGLLGNPICTLYDLSSDILSRTRLDPRKRVSDMQKLLMLKEIVLRSPSGYFDQVRECPSFPEALGGEIGAMKVAAIEPGKLRQAVEAAADRLPESSRRKILDFAALYHSYQKDVLEARNIHDPEGVLWRAVAVATENPRLLDRWHCVIVDGLPSLAPVQREFVKLIATHCRNLVVTLEYEPDRPEVFSPMEETYRFLLSLPDTLVERIEPESPKATMTALRHVERNVFRPDARKRPADNTVTLLAGATPAMEVELIAGEIRRLIRGGQYSCSDMAVVSRDTGSYEQRIASVFHEYGIPVAGRILPLSESALAQTVLLCLRAVLADWQRDHVLPVLKSSYVPCDAESCSAIENCAKALGKQKGRDTWFEQWGAGDLTLALRTSALELLAKFADGFTGSGASRLTEAVGALMKGFRLHDAGDRLQEDVAARNAVTATMGEIVEAERLLGREFEASEVARLLEFGISSGTCRVFGRSADGVSVLGVNSLAGQKFSVTFVLGLLEKVFPRQVREDPFLRDAEREVLNPYLPHPLEPRMKAQDYERYLFYMAVSSARERLYLAYPASDASAEDSLPSFYLDEVRSLFSDRLPYMVRNLSDVVPPPDQAETGRSLLARTILGCCEERRKDTMPLTAGLYNRFLRADTLSPEAFAWMDDREARVGHSRIREHFERSRVFGITELETYGACPFRHFCEHELKLADIEEEPGALRRGAVLHRVLYRLYSTLFADGAPSDRNMDHVYRLATGLLDDVIAGEASMAAMTPTMQRLERNTMADMLRRFLHADLRRLHELPFAPKYFELEFGRPDDERRDRDSASTPRRYACRLDDGAVVELAGKIDRVDVDVNNRAMIIDYKTGGCPGLSDIDRGTLLQVPLYALALKELFGLEPVAAEYRSLKKPERQGIYADTICHPSGSRARNASPEAFDGKTSTALGFVSKHVAGMREAIIGIAPVDCASYCNFRSVCRVDRWQMGNGVVE